MAAEVGTSWALSWTQQATHPSLWRLPCLQGYDCIANCPSASVLAVVRCAPVTAAAVC